MAAVISKTTFLSFLECPKDTWLRMHRPDEVGTCEPSDFELHLLEQGNEVEAEARKLFPDAVLITATGDDALTDTERLMDAKTPALFQATFLVDGFLAKNDVLAYDAANDRWDVYEVKGTNAMKEESAGGRDHTDDVAFQVSVLRRAGVAVGRCFVIHLNKNYVRAGDIDLAALFEIEEVTEKIEARLPQIEQEMHAATAYVHAEQEPAGGCACVYKARKKHCTSFRISHPEVPDYSVHDLVRVTKEKLTLLIERGIVDLNDIPDDFELTTHQQNQVRAHKQQEPMIDRAAIQQELGALSFPLYFFDYEAFGPAIPAFDGYGPYKHIPFQFSLHILRSPEAPLEHVEFLHDRISDPSTRVAELLKEHVPRGGTVIAWYKHFERMINTAIGTRNPAYAAFFDAFNDRIYDLMDVFHHQQYVHPGFKGKSSIKKVLPTLAPELRYDLLNIKEGGQAADAWWRMVAPQTPPDEQARIARDLKIYCGLDTYAMYAIWHHLQETIHDGVVPARSLYAPIHTPTLVPRTVGFETTAAVNPRVSRLPAQQR